MILAFRNKNYKGVKKLSYSVEIPDIIYQRLQTYATPFVDTPATVIEKLLNFYETHHSDDNYIYRQKNIQPPVNQNQTMNEIKNFKPDTLESLKHTKVRQAKFGGYSITSPNWNKIKIYAHEIAVRKLGFKKTIEITLSNVQEGEYTEDGYKYLKDINLSIQGQNSYDAWESTLKLARELSVTVEVEIEWRNKPDALYPGKKTTLSWSPNKR